MGIDFTVTHRLHANHHHIHNMGNNIGAYCSPYMMISGMGPMMMQYDTMTYMMVFGIIGAVVMMCCCCCCVGGFCCWYRHEERKDEADRRRYEARADENGIKTLTVITRKNDDL